MSEIFLDQYTMHTIGTPPKVGDQAPQFTVTDMCLGPVSLEEYKNKPCLIHTYPSLETKVCFETSKRINSSLKDIKIFGVSMDLPFALKRMHAESGLDKTRLCSDFKTREFAVAYGLLIQDGPLAGLLPRSLILLNRKHEICHIEIPENINAQLDVSKVKSAWEKKASG